MPFLLGGAHFSMQIEKVGRNLLQRHRQSTGVPPVEFATKQAGIRSTMGERMWAEGREVKPHGPAASEWERCCTRDASPHSQKSCEISLSLTTCETTRSTRCVLTSFHWHWIQDMHFIISSVLWESNTQPWRNYGGLNKREWCYCSNAKVMSLIRSDSQGMHELNKGAS